MTEPSYDPTLTAPVTETPGEIFPGYQQAIGGLQSRMHAGPPAQQRSLSLEEAMLMAASKKGDDDEKPMPRWLHFVPGAAVGYANALKLKREGERLKMEKQRHAGLLATEQLKQAEMLNKLREREALAQSMKSYGALQRYSGTNPDGTPLLDEESRNELRGNVLQGLAGTGDAEGVGKFIESEREQRVLDLLDRYEMGTGSGGQAGLRPEESLAPPAEPTPAAPAQTGQAPQASARTGTTLPASYTNLAPHLRQRIDAAVAQAATETGLDPSEIYGLIATESDFDPAALSPKGAAGLTQLMPATAKRHKVNPASVEENIAGGAREYARLKAKYTDPRLVAAAYNAGEGAVADYKGVPPYGETEAFIPRLARNIARFATPASASAAQPPPSRAAQAATAAPPTTAERSAGEAWMRDRLRLAGLRQETARLELLLQQTTRFAGTKLGKGRREAWESQLKDLRSEVQHLEKKVSFQGHALEQTSGIPLAYLTGEQMQQAGQDLQDREIAKSAAQGENAARVAGQRAKETELGKAQAEREVRERLTAAEVLKDDVERHYDTTTGQPVRATMKFLDLEHAQESGAVRRLSKNQTERMEVMNESIGTVARIQLFVDRLYGPGGILADLSPSTRQLLGTEIGLRQFIQDHPELTAAARFIQGNAEGLARALKGLKGPATDRDIERVVALLPQLEMSLDVSVYPPKIDFRLPDTRGTALRVMDSLVESLDNVTGAILQNPDFHHQALHRYTIGETTGRGVQPAARGVPLGEHLPWQPSDPTGLAPSAPQQAPAPSTAPLRAVPPWSPRQQ